MNSSVLYEQLASLVGLAGLWAIWYYLWKPQRVDIFRQKLFALRDELFDIAANGEVSFDDPAYTRLRFLLNGMIRYAHRISFPLLLISMMALKDEPESSKPDWKQTLPSLPVATREKLNEIHERMVDAFTKHLIFGSAVLTGVFIAFSALWGIKYGVSLMRGMQIGDRVTSAAVRRKVAKTTKIEVSVIAARVLFEEQRRISMHPHALVSG